jgi:hypothetical protein
MKGLRPNGCPTRPTGLSTNAAPLEQEYLMMKRGLTVLGAAAMCFQLAAAPAAAEMSNDEKAAAALAILGIAALAHHKQHYTGGYAPATGESTAEFESCYRDGLHGYDYTGGSQDCAQGWQAGNAERENSRAHRAVAVADKAPHMAIQGCAKIVAQNFAVSPRDVHMVKSRSPGKHQWQIEAAVGHEHMVCTMRDSGEVIEVRGGRM